jgi:hypothetical protein
MGMLGVIVVHTDRDNVDIDCCAMNEAIPRPPEAQI